MDKNCYVRENADGSMYYPPTLPQPRGKLLLYYDFAPTALYLAVGWNTAENAESFILLVLLFLSAMFVNELVHTVKQFLHERQYLTSRYEGSYQKLFSNAMISYSKLFVFITCFVCSYYLYQQTSISESYNFICVFIALKFAFDVQKVLSMDRSTLDESLLIESLNGLDYGSGMAYSFFHGYLKLVLPDYGGEGKSFEQLISVYEANHNVKFRVKKLFVLIPHSAKCPATLDNPELGIEESTPLQPKIITVAGVKDRVYKNSVYKILQKGVREKVYVCVEYATVIKTLFDVFNSNNQFSEIYRKHRVDIVSQFYQTLKMILKENPECNKLCELIYYDDKLPNGKYRTDIGQILLQRMAEIS